MRDPLSPPAYPYYRLVFGEGIGSYRSLPDAAPSAADDVHRTTYLAANLMWNPVERVRTGVEYLCGLRENVDRAVGSAHRVQAAFIFDLP